MSYPKFSAIHLTAYYKTCPERLHHDAHNPGHADLWPQTHTAEVTAVTCATCRAKLGAEKARSSPLREALREALQHMLFAADVLSVACRAPVPDMAGITQLADELKASLADALRGAGGKNESQLSAFADDL